MNYLPEISGFTAGVAFIAKGIKDLKNIPSEDKSYKARMKGMGEILLGTSLIGATAYTGIQKLKNVNLVKDSNVPANVLWDFYHPQYENVSFENICVNVNATVTAKKTNEEQVCFANFCSPFLNSDDSKKIDVTHLNITNFNVTDVAVINKKVVNIINKEIPVLNTEKPANPAIDWFNYNVKPILNSIFEDNASKQNYRNKLMNR